MILQSRQQINNRKILMTDSLSNFCPLITFPKDIDKLQYSSLFKTTAEALDQLSVILMKIKSHTNPPQYFNDIADSLATLGIQCNNLQLHNDPDLVNIKTNNLRIYHIPSNCTIQHLQRKFKLRLQYPGASMVFDRGK